MAYIGKQPVVGNFVKLDAITTSATATYNLLNGGVAYFPQTANNCIVSLNGVIQSPTSAYTISGSTIVFDSALTSDDSIDFILVLGDVLNIGTPSDNTVSTAKLATDLTVTHALGSASTPSITFTGDTNTGIFSPTADTIAFTEGGTESLRIDSSANLQFNSGFGSVATAYGCRAWVNFNGSGTPSIRASGNVTSITDNGTGNFTVNFTTAMPDADYAGHLSLNSGIRHLINSQTTSGIQVFTYDTNGNLADLTGIFVAVFR
jgi:hypothetical protein